MFCTKCGKELTGIEGGFCSNCGAKTTDKSAAAAKPPVSGGKKGIKLPMKVLVPILAAVLLVSAGAFVFLRLGTSGKGNTYGNTPGNILNYGYVAIHSSRIYYINGSDGDKIYTMKTDGSDRKLLD